MKSVILTVGDEILIGQVINTNAAFIARKLNEAGVEVSRVLTVGDRQEEIVAALDESCRAFEAVVMTGGLGPTHDDVTKKALCAFFGTDLVSSPEARANIEALLESRSHRWSEAAEEQTLLPRGSTLIPNRLGTASGIMFERDRTVVIALPGVPYEMEGMMEEFVGPHLSRLTSGTAILHRTLKTTGITESSLAARIGDPDRLLGGPGATLAFLPSPTGVRMRITIVGADRAGAGKRLERVESEIRAAVGSFIYGVDAEELEEVVGHLLAGRGLTIAVAESCTGGLIAERITNVPGSSRYFDRGLVAYSNRSKLELLPATVRPGILEAYGAVSKETAEAMAHGVREMAGAGIGLSTTGIAGPSGGSADKPVGTVWIGYSDEHETLALRFQFGSGRLRIRERAAQAALELVRRKILRIG